MTWAHYLLQVNIYLVIFYAFYKLLLDKETYFMLNRIYLIAAGMLSLVIPFLRPEWFIRQPATQQIKISVDQLNMMMAQGTVSPDEGLNLNPVQILVGIYLIGILFFLGRFIFQLFAVRKLVRTKPSGSAFSFFSKKIIDPEIQEFETIQTHEEIHVRQYHTADVLFFELLGILVWCNPIIYFYKTTVKNIHEYLADEEAVRIQGDAESYSILLLSQALGVDQHILTNRFFNKSLIKKRIFMLHKQRSRKIAILKYGLFLPLFAVTLLLSSATISKNENLKAVAEEITVPVAQAASSIQLFKPKAIIQPENKGGWNKFYNYLSRTVKYPKLAYQYQLQGNVLIKFTLTSGVVSGISTGALLGQGCDAEVMRTIMNFDDFKSVDNGHYTIKVAFRLPGVNTRVKNNVSSTPKGYTALNTITITSSAKSGEIAELPQDQRIYDFVSLDKQPGFPGGMDKFYTYIKAGIRYPKEAIEKNIQGKVFLSFIVEDDGQLSDIKVTRGIGGGADEEAVRLLSASPKWTPGTAEGHPVKVKYNIPITFALNNGSGSSVTAIQITPKPLYVIDGKIVSDQEDFKLKNINPNDIESMSILKDEEAIKKFGDAAKNGVILITTKKKN
ncbi:M56 family metallopeptidase [Pedobacter cryoconitis]|uniref:TonB family protein n=1 Tax=Pedobacter cryoconitis TaxID=188932 RepID=A0A7X0J2A2_9SPHI|nr:M56 family metallopeptidase [Pedobacter cryoconitis]MBB6499784.1 TonB family protein [Pedobacter cryoconitis]